MSGLGSCLVFERFTEGARQVVVWAQEEARTLQHGYIGTEHLLLGVLRVEDGLGAGALAALNVTIEAVRAQVARIVDGGGEVTTGQMPFTPRSKKVLELALREALSLGHNYVGTEHILLGLVRENEGVAARILLDFHADADTIRNEVVGLLSDAPAERPRRRARPPGGWTEYAPDRPPVSWEYLVETVPAETGLTGDRLNELGSAGWELVSVVQAGESVQLVFKRARNQSSA